MSYSNEYIDKLMTSNKEYKQHLSPSEYYFTNILLCKLRSTKFISSLNYQIMFNTINYKIGPYQIGRLSLSKDDTSGKIQVLYSNGKVKVFNISHIDEATPYIDEWIRYAESL